MENKKGFFRSAGRFVVKNGFYIVVFVCVAAIGTAGWMLLSNGRNNAAPEEASAWLGEEKEPTRIVVVEKQPEPVAAPAEEPTSAPDAAEAGALADALEVFARETAYSEDEAETAAYEPEYVFPTDGKVLNGFSVETLAYDETLGDWRAHDGVDFSCVEDMSARCIASGVVSEVYDDELLGMTVVVDHGGGMRSATSNLAELVPVCAGQELAAGDVIGSAGDTAVTETGAPHIHLALTVNGDAVDPMAYLG